jgi:hypothetical protein
MKKPSICGRVAFSLLVGTLLCLSVPFSLLIISFLSLDTSFFSLRVALLPEVDSIRVWNGLFNQAAVLVKLGDDLRNRAIERVPCLQCYA